MKRPFKRIDEENWISPINASFYRTIENILSPHKNLKFQLSSMLYAVFLS